MATDARQHLNKAHREQTLDLVFLEKSKTAQCPDCGKFIQSCIKGTRRNKCEAHTPNATTGCT